MKTQHCTIQAVRLRGGGFHFLVSRDFVVAALELWDPGTLPR